MEDCRLSDLRQSNPFQRFQEGKRGLCSQHRVVYWRALVHPPWWSTKMPGWGRRQCRRSKYRPTWASHGTAVVRSWSAPTTADWSRMLGPCAERLPLGLSADDDEASGCDLGGMWDSLGPVATHHRTQASTLRNGRTWCSHRTLEVPRRTKERSICVSKRN